MATRAAPSEIRWLTVDRSVRRRVARSVRSGAAVSRPEEAAVAVGYCAATLEWLSQPDRLRPFHLVVAVVLAGDLLVTWTSPVAPLLGALLGFGFIRLRTPALRRRLLAALEANVEVEVNRALSPVSVRLPGQSWLGPGIRRRRLVTVLEAALAMLAFAALVAVFLPTNGRWAAAANRVCVRQETRLEQLRERQLDPIEALRRRIVIEREALVALGNVHAGRTPLASRLPAWRRYEVELDAWLLAATGDPRVPAQRVQRVKARHRAQDLAKRLGATACARV